MALALSFLIVIVSAIIVLFTANFALRSSVSIAKKFKMSDELIGMTILSIGTSLPEIITHIVGSFEILARPSLMNSVSALVVGTNIGSDIFQQNFIISVIALVGVLVVAKKHLVKDVGGLVAAAVLVWIFSYNGFISKLEGGVLFFGYIAYLFVLKKYGMAEEDSIIQDKDNRTWKHVVIVLASFVLMAFAADKMVNHSVILVRQLPISASFFGVILLGIAAAFPELMTALLAVYRKKAKISAGVLIGSNITNPMFALGLGAMISSYTVPNVVVWYDLPVKIATALLILWFLWKGKLKKRNAVILILLYLAYLFFRQMFFPADII
jgi:cation:H+ antiporter